eukprot:TRINITY_DN111464_c0_g1_i1.p1 TRINITY_DN111464_c0_g1~~TRINITY_DN111464_c0_g1_i1.p1  ORF type:complete len:100 (+),score=0.42 TRINITY_DN111464_c0_g1_i1:257-556(+)
MSVWEKIAHSFKVTGIVQWLGEDNSLNKRLEGKLQVAMDRVSLRFSAEDSNQEKLDVYISKKRTHKVKKEGNKEKQTTINDFCQKIAYLFSRFSHQSHI